MIIITGASDGLGYQIAKVFKESGKRVINISREKSTFADVNLLHDLSKPAEIEVVINEILSMTEPIEVLVNNAGIWGEEALNKITHNKTQNLMAVNAQAPILLTSGLLDRIKKDQADIVNVVSTAGRQPSDHHAVYVASKWAERGFTDSLRQGLKDTLCRVIGFYPGGISTSLFVKDTKNDITKDGTYWMDPGALALCIKQLVDLPKGIEVTDIILERKKQFK